MTLARRFAGLILLLLAAAPARVAAQCQTYSTPLDHFFAAPLVFRAVPEARQGGRVWRLRVLEVYKGDLPAEIDVDTRARGAAENGFAYPFIAGSQYLIDAERQNGRIFVGGCLSVIGLDPMDGWSKLQLEHMRQLRRGWQSGVVLAALAGFSGRALRAPTVDVTLTGPKTLHGWTGRDGLLLWTDVPPGHYDVTLKAPRGEVVVPVPPLDVVAGRPADVRIQLRRRR